MIKAMLAGAIMVNAWAIGVFFWRFWRKTGDWLFWCFAAAFFLLGVERVALVLWQGEGSAYVYLIRLCAFILIAAAIVGKNLRRRPR
jgi:hypothetical protein